MIHVGTTPVCLKRQEKNSRVHTLGLGVLPPTGATANLLVRGAHRQRLHLKRSGMQHFTWAGRQSAIKVGHGVLAISVAAGTGADVMASGAGAAGPAQDVHHLPPGYPDLLPYNTEYPGLSQDIQTYPKTRLSRDMPGYPGIARPGVYPVITHNNTA